MSTLVQISGNPGTGKTFSVKSLAEKDPKAVFVINTDGKNLSWAGWRSHFSNENKNYLVSSDAGKIADYLKIISDKKPEIKVVVVDTINTIMSDKEIADRKRPGFDENTCRSKSSLIAGNPLRSIHYSIIMKYG